MRTFAPQPPELDCLEYSDDLYVTRPTVETLIREWLRETQPQHLIRSLVGPPGTGKSWVIAHLRDESSLSCGKLYLTARNLLNEKLRDQVKQNLIRAANLCCPELRFPSDTQPTLEAIIEDLSTRMMQTCGSNSLLLLVDGCDDLNTPEEFEQVQELLATFFGYRTTCFRMIISRRSRLTYHPLRLRDLPIQVDVFRTQDGPDSAEEQKRKLLQLAGKKADIIDLKSILPESRYYQWNHPFINCFLLQKWLRRSPVTSNALRICCLSLANRPVAALGDPGRYPSLDNDALDLLIRLADELPECWNNEEFRSIAKRELETEDTQRGIIINVRTAGGRSTSYYSIADGLRELLKDIAKMQHTEVFNYES